MSDYVTFDIPSINTRGRVKDGMLQIEQPLNEMNWHQPRPVEPGENIKRDWAWVYVQVEDGQRVPLKLDEMDKYKMSKEGLDFILEVQQAYLDAKGNWHPVNLF